MGCTRICTPYDHREAMKSLGRDVRHTAEPLTKERREAIRAALHRSSASNTLIKVLDNPKNAAFEAVKELLAKSMPSDMTTKEKEQLPHAFRKIIKDHPTSMGLFLAATKERAPGQSAVQHHYEILSAAALMETSFKTASGKMLSIEPVDRVDFGMKMAAGYTQPRRFGTIEADALVHKNTGVFGLEEKTVGIDVKYSKTEKYGAKKEELTRQIEGIRTGFRDGKLDEFVFVTNGVFAKTFKKMVEEGNAMIALDALKAKNISIAETPRVLLTTAEKRHQPEAPVSEDTPKDREKIRELVARYEIPQIDLCEHVTFNNYD